MGEEVFKEFEGDILQRPLQSAVRGSSGPADILPPALEMEERDVSSAGCEPNIGNLPRPGEILGGGHMQELWRTKSGSFTERNIVSLHTS